jgi:DNA polymerase III alpha subunit
MSINYTELDLTESVLRHGPNILDRICVNPEIIKKYLEILDLEKLNYPKPLYEINKDNWFMPNEYKNMDIESFLVDQCPKENYDRLVLELKEYQRRDLISLLRQMKYIVDTLRDNNIIWGVGRGSSVASYVLFLLGVHKIDSVKYNLPIEEFFKEI